MGITIFGSRSLKCWLEDGSIHTLQQSPGSIYVGNMCAVEHQVAHLSEFRRLAWKHKPNKKNLTKEWSKVMGAKTWDTLSEDALQKCVAAWDWLHSYIARRADDPNLKIPIARWSKLVAPCVVITNGSEFYASIGNAIWGVLD